MLLILSLLAAPVDPAALYQKHCAVCHDAADRGRAPSRRVMDGMKPEGIVASLTTGSMAAQGKALTVEERAALATLLTGKAAAAKPAPALRRCVEGGATAKGEWNGWAGPLGTRYQPDAGLSAAEVGRLQLKWSFAFPNANAAPAQPVVSGGRVYAGSMTGEVYALDQATGCVYWVFQASGGVRAAVSIGGGLAYFGDMTAHVYAVDARTGAAVWKVKVDEHSFARLTGSVVYHGGRLYVPVSSHEEVAGGNAKYVCCTFRGSVVALEGKTGKALWKTYSIEDAPKELGKNKNGVPVMGPAGGAIWSAPTIDAKRGVLYAATGNIYTDSEAPMTDAVIAMDLVTGAVRWARQMTEKDWWNFSCQTPDRVNCASPSGPDYDFGASPLLQEVPGGKSILVAAQKSGMVYGMDPDDKGKVRWQTKVGQGGPLGGVEWGHAADGSHVYAAVSDIFVKNTKPGGLFALRLADGEKAWYVEPKPACPAGRGTLCHGAQSAAISVMPGVVFSGSYDGHVRAYATADGSVLWEYQTARKYDEGEGGSIDVGGPAIAGGMVFTSSGYGTWRGMTGNVLLAFSVDGK